MAFAVLSNMSILELKARTSFTGMKAAVIWTSAAYVSTQAMRFIANIIFAIFLTPEAFGLLAIVNAWIVGMQMVSDLGFAPLIQRRRKWYDKDFLNTAWTVQVLRGFCLFGLCILAAWPISKIFNEPQLLWLLPLTGLSLPLLGMCSLDPILMAKKGKFSDLAIFEALSQGFGVLLSLSCLYIFNGPIVLTIAAIAAAVARCVLSWTIYNSTSHLWDIKKKYILELYDYGKCIVLNSALTFLGSYADRFILGYYIGITKLGYFAIALAIAEAPRQLIQVLSGKVFVPLISSCGSDARETLYKKIYNKRNLFLSFSALFISSLFAWGDLIITTLYTNDYHEAGWMVKVLSIGLWPTILSLTSDPILYVRSKPWAPVFGSLFKLLYLTMIPVIYLNFGIVYALIWTSFKDFPFWIMIQFGLKKINFSFIKQDFYYTLIFIALSFAQFHLRNL